jgi:transposase
MVKNGEHFMIKEMQQKGMSVTRIAEELGRDRKTIRKWLQEEEVRIYQRSIIKKSLLEPFKSYVKERME